MADKDQQQMSDWQVAFSLRQAVSSVAYYYEHVMKAKRPRTWSPELRAEIEAVIAELLELLEHEFEHPEDPPEDEVVAKVRWLMAAHNDWTQAHHRKFRDTPEDWAVDARVARLANKLTAYREMCAARRRRDRTFGLV